MTLRVRASIVLALAVAWALLARQPDILIAGGRNMYTALKAKVPFLDINQEREFGYEGYQGMLELVRQLALTIESPVWEAVRAKAPWKKRDYSGGQKNLSALQREEAA